MLRQANKNYSNRNKQNKKGHLKKRMAEVLLQAMKTTKADI